MKKRFFTALLSFIMIFSLLPTSVLAATGSYRVDVKIGKTLDRVTVTLSGDAGTYSAYSAGRVQEGTSLSVTGVPQGTYKVQVTGTGEDGISYKGIASLDEYLFLFASNGAFGIEVMSFEKDVNNAVTLSFRFTNPKKAQDGLSYPFEHVNGYLIATADYAENATEKRYPLKANDGFMSAQVPANQEYKLVAEGWNYEYINGGAKDLTVKQSFKSTTWNIADNLTAKDYKTSISVSEADIEETIVNENYIGVPIQITDAAGISGTYQITIQDAIGNEYSAETNTGNAVIMLPATTGGAAYAYTLIVAAEDGRSISWNKYTGTSFYTVTRDTAGVYTAQATYTSENPLNVALSNNYADVTVNVYGDGQLKSSRTAKVSLETGVIAANIGDVSDIAQFGNAELLVDGVKKADSSDPFFQDLEQYNIPAGAKVIAKFYYNYIDDDTEYTVTVKHQFYDADGNVKKSEESELKIHAGEELKILKQSEHGENWISQKIKQIEGYRDAGAWQVSIIRTEGGDEDLRGKAYNDINVGVTGTMPHDDLTIIFVYHYIDNYIEYIANANDAVGEMYVDWCETAEIKTIKGINNGEDNYYSRTGYVFASWNTKADGTGKTYMPGETVRMSDSPLTLYAQWRPVYIPTPTPTPSKPALNTADHYAYVMGYPDGTVQPGGYITRAEASTIFFRLLTDETREQYWATTNAYSDIKSGDWYNNAISTLSNAGIVSGYPDGTFRPNAPITRAEMAKIIAIFAKLDKTENRFTDIAGHWAEAYIKLAAGNGWIEGYPDGTFKPQQNITRAETVTMINRVLERVPSDEDHLLSERVMLTFPDCKSGQWFYIAIQEATNSHTYERAVTEKNGDEQWTALRDNRDWTLLEK